MEQSLKTIKYVKKRKEVNFGIIDKLNNRKKLLVSANDWTPCSVYNIRCPLWAA